MKINIETDGFDEVLERFKAMEKAAKNDIAKDALSKAGDIMLESLKSNAPKGETGNLTASMGIISKGTRFVTVGHANAIDRTAIYHFYQHYGNSFTNATNFFSVAYFEAREECYEIIKQTILKAMGF